MSYQPLCVRKGNTIMFIIRLEPLATERYGKREEKNMER